MVWIALLAAVAAFLIWVSRKPDTFRIERQIEVRANAADVFAWINNVRRFNEWNPWLEIEPSAVVTYTGPEEGPQATYAWVGKKTGEGRMTLADQKPPHEVNFALTFIKPWKADNKASFQLREGNGTTVVIWAMTGASPFLSKLFSTFVNIDRMVGKDFERGLARLKSRVEAKTLS